VQKGKIVYLLIKSLGQSRPLTRMKCRSLERSPQTEKQGAPMSWTTPEVKEICVGMEINDYMPAEF